MDGSALGLLASGGLNTLGSAATMGSSNQAQACGLAAYISGAAATIQAAQGGTCLIKVSSCMDSCKRATGASGTGSKITKGSSSGIAAKHLSECNAMHRLGLADIQQSLQNAASTASSLACANAASGLATNYALPNGAQDCSNPVYAAQSTYCICLSNPRDVRCLANAGQAGGLNGALGTSGGLNGAAGIDPSAYQGDTGPAFADRSAAPAGGPQAPQAMGGSGMGPSSPSGPAPAGEGDGATPNGNVASILGNSTGGSGAFSYGKSDSSKDGGGLGGMLSKLKKFNFGGLLPNKDKIQRGVAGGGADGITGANGPSIWEKVSTQYQKKKSELLP
jgi:hypothetical protein